MITSILKRMTPARPQMAALVGMLVGIFLLTGVLFYQAYDAARGQQEQAREMLLSAANRAAGEWHQNLRTIITNGINYTFNDALATGRAAFATAEEVARLINLTPLCSCDGPEYYRGVFVYGYDDQHWETAGIPLPHATRDVVLDLVNDRAGSKMRGAWRVAIIARATSLPQSAIAYAAQFNSDDEPVRIVGVHIASAAIERFFAELWPKARFIQTGDLPGDSVFAVRMADAEGTTWFQSRPTLSQAYTATDTLLTVLPGFSSTFAVLPGAESKLILGGMPRSRLPFLVALIGMTLGLLVVTMLLIRRESEITRLRSDFVAGVSHELRTPLSQIRMFTETLMLSRVRSESERQRSLEIIDQEAKRLTHLVENVLAFARSERGSTRLRIEPTDVAADIRDAIHGFAILSRTRAVEIRPELQEDIMLSMDRGALRQILLNLLDNAVKYGPLGQRVTVGLALFGGAARIWVDDEGPGIPQEDRTRVFESFYRLERDAGSSVHGSGIGLAIVRELVELHEGRVWIDEAPGGGARVVVEVPRAYLRTDAKTDEWAVA